MLEQALLTGGLGLYAAATIVAVVAELRGRDGWRVVAPLLVLALLVHGTAIILRWQRLDHGP